jgi:site-specific recombinase XerD
MAVRGGIVPETPAMMGGRSCAARPARTVTRLPPTTDAPTSSTVSKRSLTVQFLHIRPETFFCRRRTRRSVGKPLEDAAVIEQLPFIDRTTIIGDARAQVVPALIAAAGERASRRFLEFFAANIRNPHTRRAYGRAVADFMAWCGDNQMPSIAAVQPLHVAAWIEQQTREHAASTAKLRLTALRHLFDWLVTGQVMPTNPAGSVRGPAYVVTAGKTPVLAPEEARALIDSIEITTPAGLRDRALIGLMVFSFARISAALGMKVEDVFTQNRRLWVRLREKGGKAHVIPCHHNLETYLTAYIDGADLAEDPKAPLFRTIGRGTGLLTRTPLPQANAYAMVGRRAAAAGIATKLGNHSFRATGITAYLKNGGTLGKAAQMAGHASTRTTQLYDRRREELSLDEVEGIRV